MVLVLLTEYNYVLLVTNSGWYLVRFYLKFT